MSTHTINITGVTSGVTPQSGPPPRRSIFDVVKDPKSFSLLVQALGMSLAYLNTQYGRTLTFAIALMEAADQNQAASHFQIGGIHGQPFVEWDGAGGPESVSDDWPGYCTHGTVNFPTWHRPYLALYEVCFHYYSSISPIFC